MQQLQLDLGNHFLPNIAEIKGGHQGLYPSPFRIKRVWDKIAQKPFHYCAPGSHIKLGIGEPELASTVFWLVVFKLAQYQHNHLVPTERGRWLLENFDHYLQDAQTAWLLHYWGLEPPCFMPSWWWLIHLRDIFRIIAGQCDDSTITR